MVVKELINYVSGSLKRGVSSDEIRRKLKEYNWADDEINSALNTVRGSSTSKNEFEKKHSGRSIKIFIIALIFAIIAIIGILSYFVFNIISTETEAENLDNVNSEVRCEIDNDCESGFKCLNKICISSGSGSSTSTNSNPATIRRQVGGSVDEVDEEEKSESEEADIELINCERNLDCFINAAKKCNIAKTVHNYKTSFLGIWSKENTMYYELKGIESDKCIFYLLEENSKKDGECRISIKDLVSTLEAWKEDNMQVGTFSDEVWKNSKCSGSYFETN